jgi:hypothetical protein
LLIEPTLLQPMPSTDRHVPSLKDRRSIVWPWVRRRAI